MAVPVPRPKTSTPRGDHVCPACVGCSYASGVKIGQRIDVAAFDIHSESATHDDPVAGRVLKLSHELEATRKGGGGASNYRSTELRVMGTLG